MCRSLLKIFMRRRAWPNNPIISCLLFAPCSHNIRRSDHPHSSSSNMQGITSVPAHLPSSLLMGVPGAATSLLHPQRQRWFFQKVAACDIGELRPEALLADSRHAAAVMPAQSMRGLDHSTGRRKMCSVPIAGMLHNADVQRTTSLP
jgi:hypothetical protein